VVKESVKKAAWTVVKTSAVVGTTVAAEQGAEYAAHELGASKETVEGIRLASMVVGAILLHRQASASAADAAAPENAAALEADRAGGLISPESAAIERAESQAVEISEETAPAGVPSDAQAGSVENANFAQTSINKAEVFSPEGIEKYSKLAGRPIKTVDDLAKALNDDLIQLNQVPVDYVVVQGQKVILNTRTSIALDRAGIPKAKWYGIDRTGQEVPTMPGIKFDDLARLQTQNNHLPITGTPVMPR
jgi:hypothetical protein